MSFHPVMVTNLAKFAPDVPRGITGQLYDPDDVGEEIAEALNDYSAFDGTGSCFISHDWRDLDMPAVARLKKRRVPILCWTIRSPEEERIARAVADNVTFERYLPA